MQKQIDKFLSYDYEFLLCRRDTREPIYILKDGYNINSVVYQAEYRNVDQLDFNVPFIIRDKNMQLVQNPVWDLIKSDMVIVMEVKKGDTILFKEHFSVNRPKKSGGSQKQKIVHCFGYEQCLNNIKLRAFEGTRQLYLSPTETVEIGQGIMNLLEEKTHGDWKIGYIDPMAMNETISGQNHRKYRTFTITDTSWLSFIRDQIEPTYECICEFSYDEVNQCNIINIYHQDNYGKDLGLYISEKNYVDKLEEDINIDEMVTRLTVTGKEGLSINSVNLGQSTIDDFSWYRTLDYMPQDLLDAFNRYDALIAQKTPVFKGYLDSINALTATLNTKTNEDLAQLKSDMELLLDDKDIAISQGTDGQGRNQSQINVLINAKQSEIDAKNAEIRAISNQINAITDSITALSTQVKLENNFTNAQLKIINRYLREASWNNENYYDADSLLVAGKKAQKKVNEPQIDLTVDLASFVDMVDCQYDWEKLKIGNLAYAEYAAWDTFFVMRIIAYTHDISNKTLKMDLSNKDFKNDADRYISELGKQTTDTSNLVNANKAMWDMSDQSAGWISRFVVNGLNCAEYRVTAGKNQTISLDERGGTFAATDDPGIIRILNNIIALSEDGKTYDLAITPQGIIAKKLVGSLLVGEKLLINNADGTVQIVGDGMIVKTPEGVVKVKIGKLDSGRYGISIYNSKGETIVDERGIYSMVPYPKEENVDQSNPLNFLIYIPPKTSEIRSAKLSFKLLPFRAYSKSAGASQSFTSESGGGVSQQQTSDDAAITLINLSDAYTGGEAYYTGVEGDMTKHRHSVHTQLNVPNHHHNVNISIDPHKHTIPAHTHPIIYGIYTDTSATGVDIYVDGVLKDGSHYTTDQTDLDITSALGGITGWHNITLTSTQLGRINCTIVIEAFILS